MKLFRLVIFRNFFLLTLLFSFGHQTMFSYEFDTAKISQLTVNGVENIHVSDIDFQEIDQNIPINLEIPCKNLFYKNEIQEKAIFFSKIDLNTWKPPKINVI